MKIYLGTDHAGFELKEKIKAWLRAEHNEVFDEGAYSYDQDDDYPDFIKLVASQVAVDDEAFGLIFGGSGQGEAMVANRYPGARAAVYYGQSLDIIRLSREHNNANILSLGAKFLTFAEARGAVEIWLVTKFSNEERHQRRINKFNQESFIEKSRISNIFNN